MNTHLSCEPWISPQIKQRLKEKHEAFMLKYWATLSTVNCTVTKMLNWNSKDKVDDELMNRNTRQALKKVRTETRRISIVWHWTSRHWTEFILPWLQHRSDKCVKVLKYSVWHLPSLPLSQITSFQLWTFITLLHTSPSGVSVIHLNVRETKEMGKRSLPASHLHH